MIMHKRSIWSEFANNTQLICTFIFDKCDKVSFLVLQQIFSLPFFIFHQLFNQIYVHNLDFLDRYRIHWYFPVDIDWQIQCLSISSALAWRRWIGEEFVLSDNATVAHRPTSTLVKRQPKHVRPWIRRVDIRIFIPAGTQHQNDVVSTSMRRDHVASTLIRRHFNVVCLLVW